MIRDHWKYKADTILPFERSSFKTALEIKICFRLRMFWPWARLY